MRTAVGYRLCMLVLPLIEQQIFSYRKAGKPLLKIF